MILIRQKQWESCGLWTTVLDPRMDHRSQGSSTLAAQCTNMKVYIGHAQYILCSTDPPTNQSCFLTGKKVDIQAFFPVTFLYKVGRFSVKNDWNLLKITQISDNRQQVHVDLHFLSTDERKKPILRMALNYMYHICTNIDTPPVQFAVCLII